MKTTKYVSLALLALKVTKKKYLIMIMGCRASNVEIHWCKGWDHNFGHEIFSWVFKHELKSYHPIWVIKFGNNSVGCRYLQNFYMDLSADIFSWTW